MTDPPGRLEAIAERWKRATRGPWKAHDKNISARSLIHATVYSHDADAEAIAAAPDDIAYLLAEVSTLRDAITEALSFADNGQWGLIEDVLTQVLGKGEQMSDHLTEIMEEAGRSAWERGRSYGQAVNQEALEVAEAERDRLRVRLGEAEGLVSALRDYEESQGYFVPLSLRDRVRAFLSEPSRRPSPSRPSS